MNGIAIEQVGQPSGHIRGSARRPRPFLSRILLAPALTLVLASTARDILGQVSVHDEVPARVAIQSLWSALDSAWNARDAERFSGYFAADVSFEFVDRGHSIEGRAAVLEHFGAQFPELAPELRHRTTVRDVRAVADGTHGADGIVEIFREGSDSTAPFRTFAIFAVMSRATGRMTIQILRIYQLPAPPIVPQR